MKKSKSESIFFAATATQAQHSLFKASTIAIACFLTCMPAAYSQQLTFPNAPPGTGGSEPAPNVIISVDNSGSMAENAAGGNTTSTSNPSKMTSLKAALTSQFITTDANGNSKVPDNRIRLAWQSMWVNSGGVAGSDSLTVGAVNSMKRLDSTHRTNFQTFIDGLSPANTTPSHKMMSNAYNYMKSPAGVSSPWADKPGTAQTTEYLGCRRTYHVFMTDGSWNNQGTLSAGNADGTATTLPSPDASLYLNGGALYNLPVPPTSYAPTSNQSRVYKDTYGGGTGQASTLSDFAFRSWAEDLQPTIANKISPRIKKSGIENVTASNGNVTALEEFWNPKNDPATWQHITQHTIGFGSGATSWTGAPDWDSSTNNNYGGDYPDLVNGVTGKSWQDPQVTSTANSVPIRTQELWHAALNGRGKFYPAVDATALSSAFSDILDNILTDSSKPLISIATSSSTLRTGLNAYIAGYIGDNWSGTLAARSINSLTGALSATETWNARTLLDANSSYAASDRFVLSYGTLPTASTSAGFEWKTWSTLPTAQKDVFDKDSTGVIDSKGQQRVDYIHGDRSKEVAKTGGIFRDRGSRLGDIVNSNIWFVGNPASGFISNDYATFRAKNANRIPMIYVGANDGMLHGFEAGNTAKDAITAITAVAATTTTPAVKGRPATPALAARTGGKELLAYIPQGIAQGNLRKLTDTSYSHQYFVDGHPFTGDFYNGTEWKTALVGTLAAGGKGYFVLDATDPTNYTSTNAANLVIADTTAQTDPDLGYIFSPPVVDDNTGNSRQVVKLNNDRWALVTGNGYNSSNEAPVLMIQYLDGLKEIKKISPCTIPIATTACAFKGGNGLSAPQLINLNGDGKADVAYAGDLKGNLWKFDLSSATESNWKVSFGGKPFFVAKTAASVPQPITTAPNWISHPKGGVMIAVGTGRNLTVADQTSTGLDTLYALYDNSGFVTTTTISAGVTTSVLTITDSAQGPINAPASSGLPNTLVKQSFLSTTVADAGYTYYSQTANPVDYSGNPPAAPAKRGWYINWPVDGQRVLINPQPFGGTRMLIQSSIPRNSGVATIESCTPRLSNERSFISVIDMITGKPPTVPPFTLTDTANANVSNANITLRENDKPGDGILITKGDKLIRTTPCPPGQICEPDKRINTGIYGTLGVRANWREIQ
jgi:type IV pilus assembly protein PilY1